MNNDKKDVLNQKNDDNSDHDNNDHSNNEDCTNKTTTIYNISTTHTHADHN